MAKIWSVFKFDNHNKKHLSGYFLWKRWTQWKVSFVVKHWRPVSRLFENVFWQNLVVCVWFLWHIVHITKTGLRNIVLYRWIDERIDISVGARILLDLVSFGNITNVCYDVTVCFGEILPCIDVSSQPECCSIKTLGKLLAPCCLCRLAVKVWVLWHCRLGHLTCKIVAKMTYNVSSGMLNTTILYTLVKFWYWYW